MLPDRALHHLARPEQLVILEVVEQGGAQHTEVEYLMAGSAEVKSAGGAPLRALNNVYDRSLDVDVAAEGVNKRRMWRYILLHKREHEEHGRRGEAQDDVHYSADRYVLWLIEPGHQGYNEAPQAGQAQYRHINLLVHWDKRRNKRVMKLLDLLLY